MAMRTPEFYAKRLLFPGLDLHTRSRYRFLPPFFQAGDIDTLDAGCGNGALSYAAYRLGNRVLAISLDETQILSNRAFFGRLGVDKDRFQFEIMNLYDLGTLKRRFDQIICSETLEHIQNERQIIEYFYKLLKPSGILHLCCPYALHSEHNINRMNVPEDGGHVRDGYTMGTYRNLLGPAGFEIIRSVGIGSPLVVILDRHLRLFRNRWGEVKAIPLFMVFFLPQLFDFMNPPTPYSLYVQARKL